MKLHKVLSQVKTICSSLEISYNFKVDDGGFETRIDINENGAWARGNGKAPAPGFQMFCPDLIDFNRGVIIEFEEEAKPHTGYFGAKLHKGHVQEMLTVRDEERDSYYNLARFHVHKVWESDFKSGAWVAYLTEFLLAHKDEVKYCTGRSVTNV